MTNEIIISEEAYQFIREDYRLLTKKADQIADLMFELARKEEFPNKYEDLCKCIVHSFTTDKINYVNLMDGSIISLPAYLLAGFTDEITIILKLILSGAVSC